MLPSRHKKSPHDLTQATSTLGAICGFAGLSPTDHCRNEYLVPIGSHWCHKAESGKMDGTKLINKGTSVLIFTPSKREDTGTWKLLLPTPDPDKEVQTFILLTPVHLCMLKTSLT